ncbi:MAG: hypothetical protein HY074_10725 [Deltaproteobacteria bacterium]|nr:hypothetical protein [Deltaproteobacteria bacterium]
MGALTAWTVRADENSADWGAFTARWECRETGSSTIPASTDFKVRFNFKTGQSECPEFTKALADARNFRDVDYFSCFQLFSEKMRIGAGDWCDKQTTKTGLCTSRKELNAKFNSMLDAVTDYGSFALKNNAFTPFNPGDSARPPLTTAERTSRGFAVTGWCYLSGPEYLDGSFIKDDLPGLLKKSSCEPAAIAHEYVRLLLAADVPQAVCEKVPERCAQRRASIRHAFDLLNKAGLADNIGDVKYLEPVRPECKTDDGLDKRLAEIYLRSDKLAGCVKQVENDPKGEMIGQEGRATGTGLSARYNLNRRGDEALAEDYVSDDGTLIKAGTKVPAFEASVKLSFHPDGSDVASGAIQEKYAARARECYGGEPAKSKLRGPGGEHLQIKLVDPDPDPKKPNASGPFVTSIAVPASEMRANSALWNPNISCPVILHETLHILGLVDEYQETSDGAIVAADGKVTIVDDISKADKGSKTFKKWDCRIYGPADSMMSGQEAAFSAVDGKYDVAVCNCRKIFDSSPTPAKNCKKLIAKLKVGDTVCPKGSLSEHYPTWDYKDTLRLTIGKPLSLDDVIVSITHLKSKRSTLLYPAQFRAITRPGCVDENKIFYLCAREAYKTSRDNLGTDRCGIGLPKECKNGSSDWLR